MNVDLLTKEGLLGASIFLIPLGTNLILSESTLIAGIVCLVLGVGSVGFRAWLKVKYEAKKLAESLPPAPVEAPDDI